MEGERHVRVEKQGVEADVGASRGWWSKVEEQDPRKRKDM
jgi:hypothetical protein